jgi:hypothetical protein
MPTYTWAITARGYFTLEPGCQGKMLSLSTCHLSMRTVGKRQNQPKNLRAAHYSEKTTGSTSQKCQKYPRRHLPEPLRIGIAGGRRTIERKRRSELVQHRTDGLGFWRIHCQKSAPVLLLIEHDRKMLKDALPAEHARRRVAIRKDDGDFQFVVFQADADLVPPAVQRFAAKPLHHGRFPGLELNPQQDGITLRQCGNSRARIGE